MEVSVSKLRAELKDWIDAARRGEDVVITDRGVPVARLTGVESADLISRLQQEGLITAPAADRPAATPLSRGDCSREHREREVPRTQGPLSDLARPLPRWGRRGARLLPPGCPRVPVHGHVRYGPRGRAVERRRPRRQPAGPSTRGAQR